MEARTVGESRLLRIPRSGLQRLMRAEGDIANLIMQATIWRRIAIISEAGGGIELKGHAAYPETIQLQRFLLRNTYPHRIIEPTQEESPHVGDYGSGHESTLPAVVLSDGRILHRPTITQLADELGITELPDPIRSTVPDIAISGTCCSSTRESIAQ